MLLHVSFNFQCPGGTSGFGETNIDISKPPKAIRSFEDANEWTRVVRAYISEQLAGDKNLENANIIIIAWNIFK